MTAQRRLAWIVAFGLLSFPAHAARQDKILEKVGFVPRLDERVPLTALFVNERGESVPLSHYFKDKPVLLNLVYFECPMLCTEVLNGIVRTLRSIRMSAGKDFDVLTVSIDPRETPVLATAKKRVYLDRYHRPGADAGWAFLTGKEPSIKALADSVGFHYAFDPQLNQFAHASGMIILTPEGRVSHYFFGVEYPPNDVRLSLLEAAHGQVGSPVDKLLLYCYHYDPATGRYGVAIRRVLRIAAVSMVLLLALAIWGMNRFVLPRHHP